MANTHIQNTPSFSRIVSKGRPTSWTLGIPITVLVVAMLGLIAFFASRASTYSSQLEESQKALAAQQQTTDANNKKLTGLEGDLALAHNPGNMALTLAPTKESNGAWASAVVGDQAGKGFAEVRAYGLKPAAEGKAFQAWMQSGTEKPVLLGILDPGPNGAAFAMGKDLPMAKDGRVFVNLGDASAKDVNGATILEAKIGAPAAKAAADDAE